MSAAWDAESHADTLSNVEAAVAILETIVEESGTTSEVVVDGCETALTHLYFAASALRHSLPGR